MAILLKGAPVAAALAEKAAADAKALQALGITPTLAILRVGSRQDSVSYERGATKRCMNACITVRSVVLPEDTSQTQLLDAIAVLNRDSAVHGILLLQPLPPHINAQTIRRAIAPQKDVDGVTDSSLAGVFTGSGVGFAPCTAQSVMELLHYYDLSPAGKNALVIGRSLVVGRPVAMLLMAEGATVTICHSKTEDLPAHTRTAQIIIAAAGQRAAFGAEHCSPNQIIMDVGIHINPETGELCGDVRFDEAEPIVRALTPVPGGIGSVTTSVLATHVTEAARRSLGNE